MTEPRPPRRRRAFDWSTASVGSLALIGAGIVYLRDGQAHFLEIFKEDIWLLAGITPNVLAGCMIAVFITFLLPREVVVRWIGEESGYAGLIVAAVIAPIVPGGPITIYPVAGALFAMGADGGAIVAFLTSWTLIGMSRALVWEMPFFGPHFVFWRILLALPLPILAGLLARFAIRLFALKLGEDR